MKSVKKMTEFSSNADDMKGGKAHPVQSARILWMMQRTNCAWNENKYSMSKNILIDTRESLDPLLNKLHSNNARQVHKIIKIIIKRISSFLLFDHDIRLYKFS